MTKINHEKINKLEKTRASKFNASDLDCDKTNKKEIINNIIEMGEFYETAKEIKKSQSLINNNIDCTSIKTVRKEYQKLACSVLMHLNRHKDIRLCRSFIDKMPIVLNRRKMINFLLMCGQLKTSNIEDINSLSYCDKSKLCVWRVLEIPWWE